MSSESAARWEAPRTLADREAMATEASQSLPNLTERRHFESSPKFGWRCLNSFGSPRSRAPRLLGFLLRLGGPAAESCGGNGATTGPRSEVRGPGTAEPSDEVQVLQPLLRRTPFRESWPGPGPTPPQRLMPPPSSLPQERQRALSGFPAFSTSRNCPAKPEKQTKRQHTKRIHAEAPARASADFAERLAPASVCCLVAFALFKGQKQQVLSARWILRGSCPGSVQGTSDQERPNLRSVPEQRLKGPF